MSKSQVQRVSWLWEPPWVIHRAKQSWFKIVKAPSVNVSLLSGNLTGWSIQQSNHDSKVSKRQLSTCLFSLWTSLGDWYDKAIMIQKCQSANCQRVYSLWEHPWVIDTTKQSWFKSVKAKYQSVSSLWEPPCDRTDIDVQTAATTEVGVVYTHCRRGPHCTLSRSCTWAPAAPHTSPQRPNLSTTNTYSEMTKRLDRVWIMSFSFDRRIYWVWIKPFCSGGRKYRVWIMPFSSESSIDRVCVSSFTSGNRIDWDWVTPFSSDNRTDWVCVMPFSSDNRINRVWISSVWDWSMQHIWHSLSLSLSLSLSPFFKINQ